MFVEASGAQTFKSMQPYLFTVAYRMTGSASDAEDLVQDAWLRYLDAGSPPVESLRAYLTKVVSRLSIDYLKSARIRREQYVGPWRPEPVLTSELATGPAESVEQREDVSIAFLTLLEHLKPEQRIVFVLREAFDFPYEEIADSIGKTPAACRQIFHRAQIRLSREQQPSMAPRDDVQLVVNRFLAAFRSGDVSKIAELLAPDVKWVSDAGPRRLAARRLIAGADKVARGWAGLAEKWLSPERITHEIVDLNGSPALVARYRGDISHVTVLDVRGHKISGIHNILNPEKLIYLATSLNGNVAVIDDGLRRKR